MTTESEQLFGCFIFPMRAVHTQQKTPSRAYDPIQFQHRPLGGCSGHHTLAFGCRHSDHNILMLLTTACYDAKYKK